MINKGCINKMKIKLLIAITTANLMLSAVNIGAVVVKFTTPPPIQEVETTTATKPPSSLPANLEELIEVKG